MLDKRTLIVLVPLLILSCSTIAYAAFTVWSNPVDVNLNYTLTLSYTTQGSVVTLTANLKNKGVAVPSVPVYFYKTDAVGTVPPTGANVTSIGNSLTNAAGDAVFNTPSTANGLYHFVARYDVP